MPGAHQKTVLIAGPTASGKSALALRLARERGGIVVNADSMQVYRELRILTARPSAEDEAEAPHVLYGHVSVAEPYSVARWLADVSSVLASARESGQAPIIVGGTGLFFKALLEGLSPIPAIPDEIRSRWRETAAHTGQGELHRLLAERDPVMASRLSPGDIQRITRALEVIDATSRSLAYWQQMPGEPLLRIEDTERLLVWPEREEVRRRCDLRFDLMMEAGALDEVRALLSLGLPTSLAAMGALGVRPLAAALRGEMTIEAAVARGKLETVQYVKRQETWLRKHMRDWKPQLDI